MISAVPSSGVAVAAHSVLTGDGVGVIPRGLTSVDVIVGKVSRIGAVGVVAGCVNPAAGLRDEDVAVPPAQAAVKHAMDDRTIRRLMEKLFIRGDHFGNS